MAAVALAESVLEGRTVAYLGCVNLSAIRTAAVKTVVKMVVAVPAVAVVQAKPVLRATVA